MSQGSEAFPKALGTVLLLAAPQAVMLTVGKGKTRSIP